MNLRPLILKAFRQFGRLDDRTLILLVRDWLKTEEISEPTVRGQRLSLARRGRIVVDGFTGKRRRRRLWRLA